MESVWVHLVSVTADSEISVSGLLLKASFVVQLVLLVLLFMSVLCWWVIGYKALALRKANSIPRFFGRVLECHQLRRYLVPLSTWY